MKFFCIVFAALVHLTVPSAVLMAQGSHQHNAQNTVAARQWDVLDLVFNLDALPDQPIDVEWSTTFTHTSGVELAVPGFYDGNHEFVVRFTPPLAGTWNYKTSSDVLGLADQIGSVAVSKSRPGRHGGIMLDAKNSRNFAYGNGENYYPIAFELDWLFALDAENENDIPDTRKLVNTLAENGFNQIVMNVYAHDVNWKKDERLEGQFDYGSPRVFPFGGNNRSPDHATLNIEYFQRLDRVIDYLDQKGIAAHLMIYVCRRAISGGRSLYLVSRR